MIHELTRARLLRSRLLRSTALFSRCRAPAICVVLAAIISCSARAALPEPMAPFTPTPDAAFRARAPRASDRSRLRLEAGWHRLDNGLTVVHVARHDLPFGVLRYVNRIGGTLDSQYTGELVAFTGDALVQAGTRWRGQVLANLEVNGVRPAVVTDPDATYVSLQVLTPAFETAIELLARTAQDPVFDPGGFSATRASVLNFMFDRYESSSSHLWEQALRRMLGDHAARDLTGGSSRAVAKLTRAQAQRCHAELYRPDASAVVVVGDITETDAVQTVSRHFGSWRAPSMTLPNPKRLKFIPPLRGVRAHLVLTDNQPQATIYFAQRGASFHSEDRAPLDILAKVIGGAYTSRTNRSLRHVEGATYGTSSGNIASGDFGMFLLVGSFETERAASALSTLLSELRRLRDQAVSTTELELAKAQLRAALADSLSTNAGTAALLASLFTHAAPDWLDHYERALDACNASCLQRTARRYLDPAAADVFVVGPAALAPELDRLGTVDAYRIREPVELKD